jgi:hypothetical protein
VTRAFKLYNPTGEPLTARLSLLCLGDRTSGELTGPGEVHNTAQISTTSGEDNTDNNSSPATVSVQDSGPAPPVPNGNPDKPVVNNPVGNQVAGTPIVPRVVAGKVTQKKRRYLARITCPAACSGTATLLTSRKFRLNGNRIAKGSVLAKGSYSLSQAGTVKVRLKPTRLGRRVLRSGKKINRAVVSFSSGNEQPVRIKRR